MVIVRPEPARSVIAPDATPLTIGILNNGDVGRSGAVTSTTTVATEVPGRLARTRSGVSAPRAEPVGWVERHDPRPSRNRSAAALRMRFTQWGASTRQERAATID